MKPVPVHRVFFAMSAHSTRVSASVLVCFGLLVALPSAAQGLNKKQHAPAVKKATPKPTPSRAKAAASGSANSRLELRTQAKQVAAGVTAAEAALAPDELAIAERVHTGVMPCELGAQIKLESDPGRPGYFNVTGKNFRFRMVPVATATGAVRLEDREAGTVWLQLANKSMLMNQKFGRRMADECVSPLQAVHAHDMKANPPRSLLESDNVNSPVPVPLSDSLAQPPRSAP